MRLVVVVLFSMILTSCTNNNNIKFNQKVKIISGFYEGCFGKVKDYSITMYGITPYTYYITIDDSCPIDVVVATGDQLEIIKQEQK